MNAVQLIIRDLIDRRLLPVAVALVALGLGASGYLMLTADSSTVAQPGIVGGAAPLPTNGPSPAQELAAATATPGQPTVHYTGTEPDPFRAAPSSASKSASSSSSTTAASTPSPASTTTSTGKSTTTTTTGTTSPTTTSKPSTPTTTAPAANAGGLTPTETYDATLEVGSGANAIQLADTERLSVLPNNGAPQGLYYGVASGGKSADIYVLPGQSASGGTCLPGPADCELVELGVGQSVTIAPSAATGVAATSSNTTTITVASISKTQHSSASAAAMARSIAVSVGAKELQQADPDVLAVYPYDAADGYVVNDNSVSVAGGSQ